MQIVNQGEFTGWIGLIRIFRRGVNITIQVVRYKVQMKTVIVIIALIMSCFAKNSAAQSEHSFPRK